MQSMRLLLLVFAHHHYLIETVAEEERGKTTELTRGGYQRNFLIAFMWIALFFHQCFQGIAKGQLGTAICTVACWWYKCGWFFFLLQVLHFFFPIDGDKVLCNFPVTLIMQLCMTAALDNIKDATLVIRWPAAPTKWGTPWGYPAVPGQMALPVCLA